MKRAALTACCRVVVAYALAWPTVVLPAFWTHYEHQKGLAELPMVTRTGQGIPGDPINVGLVGDIKDVVCAMHAAGWYPADPITLKSSIEIVGSVLLDRPYRDAPVSNLYYLGRREDLAFEKPIGASADHRHHVRLLEGAGPGRGKAAGLARRRRPSIAASASADTPAPSRTTSAPIIDAERQFLAADLETAGMVEAKYQVTGIGPTIAGRNGGGDLYYTDGEIWMLRLVEACRKQSGPADDDPEPAGDRDEGPDLARDRGCGGEIAAQLSPHCEGAIATSNLDVVLRPWIASLRSQ